MALTIDTETSTTPRTDEQIRNDVNFELKWDPKISSPDIAIAVKDGVVTLSGYANSYYEKEAAEKAAKRVYGVRAVANDLQVRPLIKRTDPEIAREAVQELQSHVTIPSDKIKASVSNGWVTLDGTVEWQYQKALAESAVKKLRGVTGSKMHCAAAPKWMLAALASKYRAAKRNCLEASARGRKKRKPKEPRGPRLESRGSKTILSSLLEMILRPLSRGPSIGLDGSRDVLSSGFELKRAEHFIWQKQ